MRSLLANIVSGFFYKKSLRDKVRTRIRYPKTRDYIRYVKNFAGKGKPCKIKTMVEYGTSNFVVVLNDKHVFKFPLKNDGKLVAERERRITESLRRFSTIKIPALKVIPYKDIVIRKYEFASGKSLTDIRPEIFVQHREHIAKQIAKFLYFVGKADPLEIRDLKKNPRDTPGYFYGWTHGDIWQNFILNPKTFNITFFINWDKVAFESILPSLRVASHHWEKFGYCGLDVDIMAEYARLFFTNYQRFV